MTDTLSTVQEVFADLTRYPAEILEPTADLEADLGVDSVKRVEIMSKLSEQFGIPQDLDVAPEQLSSIEAIARFIDDARAGKYERRTQVAEPAPAQAAAPAPTPPTARPMQAPALHGTLIPTPPPAPASAAPTWAAGASSPAASNGAAAPSERAVLSTLIDVMQEAVQRLDGARASASAPAPAMNGRRAPAESNGRHFDDGLEWFEAGPQRSTAAPAAAAVPATPASPSQGVPAPAAGFVPEGHRPFLGKVALVTGSGHGVGRAIAMYLARLGASVVVNSFHSRERGEQTAAEIVAAGGEAVHHWGSVTKEAHLRELFAAVEARHGGLDFFVSNASNGMIAPLEHITTEHWEKALSTNVIALHQGAMLARPLMLRRGGGKIVSLSSPGAHRPIHHFGCMGPAKAALESLTRYLAVELGSENIQVNAISAGPLYGELLDKYPDAEELVPYWESRTVNNVLGNEDGLAQMVAWMLSEVADMITGSVMDVDNGGALRI